MSYKNRTKISSKLCTKFTAPRCRKWHIDDFVVRNEEEAKLS
jgi:hypothetical protein